MFDKLLLMFVNIRFLAHDIIRLIIFTYFRNCILVVLNKSSCSMNRLLYIEYY